jgi:hypothetical protein
MLKLPSYPAAILAGAIGMPVFIWVFKYIENNIGSQILLFIWIVIGFFIPFIFSTGDLGYAIKVFKRKPYRIIAEDYTMFFFPAWKRTGVWFLSLVISIVILKLLEITF